MLALPDAQSRAMNRVGQQPHETFVLSIGMEAAVACCGRG